MILGDAAGEGPGFTLEVFCGEDAGDEASGLALRGGVMKRLSMQISLASSQIPNWAI